MGRGNKPWQFIALGAVGEGLESPEGNNPSPSFASPQADKLHLPLSMGEGNLLLLPYYSPSHSTHAPWAWALPSKAGSSPPGQ